MNDHETIRAMLPLAAADALSRGELSAVEEHAAACSQCRSELDALRLYSQGLGDLPQPVIPVGLLRRTRARLAQERATAADRRRQNLALGLLVLFSWAMGAASWLLVRTVTGGVWNVLGANLADPVTWLLVSVLLAWATAGVAAVTLGKRHELARRLL
jgi:hypothetical protein